MRNAVAMRSKHVETSECRCSVSQKQEPLANLHSVTFGFGREKGDGCVRAAATQPSEPLQCNKLARTGIPKHDEPVLVHGLGELWREGLSPTTLGSVHGGASSMMVVSFGVSAYQSTDGRPKVS